MVGGGGAFGFGVKVSGDEVPGGVVEVVLIGLVIR